MYHTRRSKSTDKSGCLDGKIYHSLACFDEQLMTIVYTTLFLILSLSHQSPSPS